MIVLDASQDGTFVPCTSHAKKGWLPEFNGYTRESELMLLEFSKRELKDLLHFKKQARFFSEELKYMADPQYTPPKPKMKVRKKAAGRPSPKKAAACYARSQSPPAAPLTLWPRSRTVHDPERRPSAKAALPWAIVLAARPPELTHAVSRCAVSA